MRLHRVSLRPRGSWACFAVRDTFPEGWVFRLSLGWLMLKVMVSR